MIAYYIQYYYPYVLSENIHDLVHDYNYYTSITFYSLGFVPLG
jgi:hypothetical protein